MRRKGLAWVGAGLLALAAAGCQNKVHEQNLSLHEENRQLHAQNEQLRQRLAVAPDPSQLQQAQAERQALEAQLRELESQLRQGPAGREHGLDGIDAVYDPVAGTVTVALPGDILFDAGAATLKESSKSTLNQIAAAIKRDYPNHQIFVDGHTDTDPIRRTADRWQDNWDLSAARALAVTRYLQTQGVDPSNMAARAFGETRPRATKPASRRVEIVVVTG